MWTASIINKEEREGELFVTIEYTDGINSVTEIRSTNGGFKSIDELKARIAIKLDSLNIAPELSPKITLGEISIPAKEIKVVDTTKEKFFEDVIKLKQYQTCIDLGIISKDNKDYLALLEVVKSTFSSDYLGNI
jgi:hypothetical protein